MSSQPSTCPGCGQQGRGDDDDIWCHDDTAAAVAARPRHWQYSAEPGTARRARHATARALAAWHLERLADDAVLIISELVANACRYGGSPITLTLRRTPGGIQGEIGDAEDHWPLCAHLPPRHGLRIVLSLARAVWVSPRPGGGKCVCFDLDDDGVA